MINNFARKILLRLFDRIRTADGGHLYDDKLKSIVLILEMITGDGKRIPLAVALCETENEDSWRKFFKLVLKYIFQLDDGTSKSMLEILNTAEVR